MVGKLSRKQWDYLNSAVIGVVLTSLSYAVGIWAGWTTSHLNWLEVFAVFTSYVSTYLCVVERRFNYPAGAISSAAYALLFYQSQLYNSAILNIYLVPVLVYGWIRWRKDTVTRPVTHVQLKWLPVYAAVTGALWWIGVVASNAAGGKLAWTDSFILAGTILAQFLLDNKKLENWYVWFAVDVVAVWEYFTSGLQLVGFQYLFFLANTVVGFVFWLRSMQGKNEAGVRATANLELLR